MNRGSHNLARPIARCPSRTYDCTVPNPLHVIGAGYMHPKPTLPGAARAIVILENLCLSARKHHAFWSRLVAIIQEPVEGHCRWTRGGNRELHIESYRKNTGRDILRERAQSHLNCSHDTQRRGCQKSSSRYSAGCIVLLAQCPIRAVCA